MKKTTTTDATLAQLMTAHNALHEVKEIEEMFFGASNDAALDIVHDAMKPMLDKINNVNLNKKARQSFDEVIKDISAPREDHKHVMQELLAKSNFNQTVQQISKIGSPSLFALKHVEPVSVEQQPMNTPSPKMS